MWNTAWGEARAPGAHLQGFERAVSALPYGGLGLGLLVSRQVVEAQGGGHLCDGVPGGGATFTVELPLQDTCVVKGRSGQHRDEEAAAVHVGGAQPLPGDSPVVLEMEESGNPSRIAKLFVDRNVRVNEPCCS